MPSFPSDLFFPPLVHLSSWTCFYNFIQGGFHAGAANDIFERFFGGGMFGGFGGGGGGGFGGRGGPVQGEDILSYFSFLLWYYKNFITILRLC